MPRMTPDERARTEAEILDQYREGIHCLNLLHHKLFDALDSFSKANTLFRDGGKIPKMCVNDAETFSSLIQDYRATYDRCVSLREALSNWSSVIAELPHPPR